MASKYRYRTGNVVAIPFPTSTSYPVEEGDLVVIDGGVIKAASALGDSGSAAQNRVASALIFVGVAIQKVGLQSGETGFKLTNDPGWILVATTGVFEMDCASTSWVTGNLAGIYNDATTNSDQQVAHVTAPTEAVGVVHVPLAAIGKARTICLVSLRSRYMHDPVVSSGT